MFSVQISASLLKNLDEPKIVPVTARDGTSLVDTPSPNSAFGAAAKTLAFLSSASLASASVSAATFLIASLVSFFGVAGDPSGL